MGETYYYVSFAELPSALIATTYSVSGNNGNFALGFQPDAVLVQSVDQTREVYFKSRFMEPDDTHRLDGVVSTTALTLGANGFGWATDTGVAANGTYWVLAIRTGM